jgi:hypothetical protein
VFYTVGSAASVHALVCDTGGTLYVGGYFLTAGFACQQVFVCIDRKGSRILTGMVLVR